MIKNKAQAKKHAYKIGSDHIRNFADTIRNQANKMSDENQKISELRIADSLTEIADSLMHRSNVMSGGIRNDRTDSSVSEARA